MFDADVQGTVLKTIANDLKATARYLLNPSHDTVPEQERRTKLHVTAARDMLNDLLDDIADTE